MSLERPFDAPSPASRTIGADTGPALGLAEIRDALRGRSGRLTPTDAVQALAGSAFPNRHRDLQAVLENAESPSRLRYLAAVGLARCDRSAAQDILVRASETSDPRVLAGIFRALGQIGDEVALRGIEEALPRAEGHVRAQGEFARTLIAHRLGLSPRRPAQTRKSEALELAPDCGQRVLIRPARERVAVESLMALGQRPYGIELAEEPMYEFVCDRCRGAIMLNREVTGSDALSMLRRRPAVFGLGALRSESDDRWSVAAVLLTTPDGKDIRISVHLTNGELVFAGGAMIRGEDARWTLHAVRRLGAFPIRAEGSFSLGTLRIEVAESGTRVVESARPVLIAAGPPRRSVPLRPPAAE